MKRFSDAISEHTYDWKVTNEALILVCGPLWWALSFTISMQCRFILSILWYRGFAGWESRPPWPNDDFNIRPIHLLPSDQHFAPLLRGRRSRREIRIGIDRIFLPLLWCFWYRNARYPMVVSDWDQFVTNEDERSCCCYSYGLVCPFSALFQLAGFWLARRITNFVIVEITPIGIQNLGWKFWLVWTVTNAAFLPILYFYYPETCVSWLQFWKAPNTNDCVKPTEASKIWTHTTDPTHL